MNSPNPPLQVGCDTRSIFRQSKAGLNTVFFFLDWLPNKAKNLNPSYYLLIARGRTNGFMPFPRALAQSEMQKISSSI